MKTITLKITGSEFWDRIAGLVGNGSGEVTGEPYTDGKQFYNALFANYGEVTWIPDEFCEITESNDNAS